MIETISIVLTAIGVAFALFQTLRNRELKLAIERINRQYEAEIWTLLGIVVRTFDSLEVARDDLMEYVSVHNDKEYSKLLQNAIIGVQSARRGTVDQYRNLLKEASLREEEFSLETIKKWVISGRLENQWRVQQAIRLLSTENTPSTSISLDEFLSNNQMGTSAKNIEEPTTQNKIQISS